MKKARILLGAVAFLGIVGGASAFKAKSFNGTFYCSTTFTTSFSSTTKYAETDLAGTTLYCSTTITPTISTDVDQIKVTTDNF